ncbi:ABC transporter permease [bacterium]|nr:ABC transporter permease [bacterium]MBU1984331.1 ABC transporter permease [bacterium]
MVSGCGRGSDSLFSAGTSPGPRTAYPPPNHDTISLSDLNTNPSLRPPLHNPALTVVSQLGRRTVEFAAELGRFGQLVGRVVSEIGGVFRERALFIQECVTLGVESLPLVLLVGLFTGAVSGWQGHYQFEGYLPYELIGPGTFKAVVLELGPVLTALIIAGRVSASIAAELGTMKVTEQIDALETMAISSVRYLAVPRVAAMTVMMPVLTAQAIFIAMMGASFVCTVLLGMTPNQFWGLIPNFFKLYDVFAGLLKSVFFGLSASLLGCYIGFRTEGGAEGVGMATITAFVWSCLTILVIDFLLALMLF